MIPREGGLERRDGAVAPDADARVMILVAVGRRAEEVLATGLDPLDGPAEAARDRGHHDLLRIDVALDAEAAPHLGDDDADPLLRQTEGDGDGRPHREGHLRG